MQIVTLKNGSTHQTILGEDYSIGQRTENGTVVSVMNTVCKQYEGQSLNNKRLLIKRRGGGGDIICLSAVIKYLLRKYPLAHITLSCSNYYYSLVDHIPHLHLTTHPCSLTELSNFDYFIDYDNLIETTRDHHKNIYNLFFEHAGHNISDPAMYISAPEQYREAVYAQNLLRQYNIPLKKKCILFQWEANSTVRSYPLEKRLQACHLLSKFKNTNLIIIGTQQQTNLSQLPQEPSTYHLMDVKGSLATLREIVRMMDVVIAPDSLFTHFAGELRKPCISLYGPFTGASRVKYYYNNYFFEATAACAPCFSHKRRCSNGCACWDSIPPSSITKLTSIILDNTGLVDLRPPSKHIDKFKLTQVGNAYKVEKHEQ